MDAEYACQQLNGDQASEHLCDGTKQGVKMESLGKMKQRHKVEELERGVSRNMQSIRRYGGRASGVGGASWRRIWHLT